MKNYRTALKRIRRTFTLCATVTGTPFLCSLIWQEFTTGTVSPSWWMLVLGLLTVAFGALVVGTLQD